MPNIELNDKTLQAVTEHVNTKNEATKADFPVISVSDIVQPKVRGDNVAVLIDGGIKGLAKHTIPYSDLKFKRTRRPKKADDAGKEEE